MRFNRMTQQTQSTNANKKISTYLLFITLIVLALGVASLFIAFNTYLLGDQLAAGILGAIGLIAVVLSMFLLFQSRRQSAEVKIDVPKVMTTIECQSKECNTKTVREFQRGDYVFKDLDSAACAKCGGKQMVTAIFKEVKEKEKTYAV